MGRKRKPSVYAKYQFLESIVGAHPNAKVFCGPGDMVRVEFKRPGKTVACAYDKSETEGTTRMRLNEQLKAFFQ